MTHKEYLTLYVGFTLTMITGPLLGLINTAMMGHQDDPAYIGAVAVGSLIFNTAYWLFGFLRISTVAFTAQAKGAESSEDIFWAFARPLLIACMIGCGFIVLQWPLMEGVLQLVNPEEKVRLFAGQYFHILIWGAPFVLANYVCTGWLMGLAKLRSTFILQLFSNLLNILLALLFTLKFHWAIIGVAYAGLITQILSAILALALVLYSEQTRFHFFSLKQLFDKKAFKKIMSVNSDLLVRTSCLLIMTNIFTAKSASFGTTTFAANAILFQLHYFIGIFIDGFANASSVVAGQAVGKQNKQLYLRGIKLSWFWTSISIFVVTTLFLFTYFDVIRFFTQIQDVLAQSYQYAFWLAIFPLAYGFNSVFYGLFNGATLSVSVRNSTVLALIVFLLGIWLLVPIMGNNGLWLSFILFNLVRTLYLVFKVSCSINKLFPKRGIDKLNL